MVVYDVFLYNILGVAMKKTLIALAFVFACNVGAAERVSLSKSGHWEAYAMKDEFSGKIKSYGLTSHNGSDAEYGAILYRCNGRSKGELMVRGTKSYLNPLKRYNIRYKTDVSDSVYHTETTVSTQGMPVFRNQDATEFLNRVLSENANSVKLQAYGGSSDYRLNIFLKVDGLSEVLKVSPTCENLIYSM